MDCDIAYYEYYDCEVHSHIDFVTESGKDADCTYYLYFPKDTEIDEDTPVIAYTTHGGGVAEDERALALTWAANQDTKAIFVIPYSDKPGAVCASLEDARTVLNGKGNFDAVSGQGTSSGGRAMIRAALKSVYPDSNYSFRFGNIIAYDPAEQSEYTNITEQTEALRALADQGTVLFIQTDSSSHGSNPFCNHYAQLYSELGGTSVVAEITSASHEGKFIKPMTHNSMNWAIGLGELLEDDDYQNTWYYYQDGEKIPASLEEATALVRGERIAEDSSG